MIWWFLILACAAGAALWAGLSLYLYVRRHWKHSVTKETSGEN